MSTWRQHNFVPGRKYRVLKNMWTGTSQFLSGEIIEFVKATYSRYDGSTAFIFKAPDTGTMKTWLLVDAELDSSDQLFGNVEL